MKEIQTEALILRAVDFGESDRILHLLIPDSGRLTAIAKGARRSVRRFAGALDLFNHLHIQADLRRSPSMARLDHARLIGSFDALRTDPARFALGCYLLELFDRLAPDGGNRADMRRLFSFALGALRAISIREPDARLRILLELRALDALGLRPRAAATCVRCGIEAPDKAVLAGFPRLRRRSRSVVAVRIGVPKGSADGCISGTLRALEQGLSCRLSSTSIAAES